MYFFFLLIHFFAAVFWVGGMLFFVFVFGPVYRDPEFLSIKSRLLFKIAIQFRRISYYIFIILLSSGIVVAYFKGYFLSYYQLSYWMSSHGRILILKMTLFLLLVINSIIHDFFIGPIAFKEMQLNSELWLKSRKYASFFGRSNLFISLLIAILGLAYSRGLGF
ncbi:copper resistance protein CopD [Leptospira inadai serovar Lyme]|uniref:Copper resistance protein CopD n=1 Tax=Leptospira inadai serovar Lyme TaxID=293084 RepID=A0ABX4YKC0_9LEPT|nr:copper resistance protein CopD [Leptospira inadai serovar Lyme]